MNSLTVYLIHLATTSISPDSIRTFYSTTMTKSLARSSKRAAFWWNSIIELAKLVSTQTKTVRWYELGRAPFPPSWQIILWVAILRAETSVRWACFRVSRSVKTLSQLSQGNLLFHIDAINATTNQLRNNRTRITDITADTELDIYLTEPTLLWNIILILLAIATIFFTANGIWHLVA